MIYSQTQILMYLSTLIENWLYFLRIKGVILIIIYPKLGLFFADLKEFFILDSNMAMEM